MADDDPRQYAGLVSRVAALTVDVVLLTAAVLAVGSLPSLAWAAVIGRSPGWLGVASAFFAGLLPWLYFTCFWWLAGETVGGLVIAVAVRDARGNRLGLVHSAVRSAVGLLLAPLWLVGMLGVLTNRRRRAWHDRVLGTVVVYVRADRPRR